MIFATGDTHGNFLRFGRKYFNDLSTLTKDDYMIICGDFGGLWDGSRNDRYWLDWLNDKPFTTLWVDGNHENFSMLNSFPVESWHGGSVHRIRPSILHLMRGQLYSIDGYSFFTMGGAASHDIDGGILDPQEPNFRATRRQLLKENTNFRVLGVDWWPDELPSDSEYLTAIEVLDKANWNVDFVISHCAPTSIAQSLNPNATPDPLTEFFEMISTRLNFKYWLFGHYHGNTIIQNRFVLLWERIDRIA